MATRRRAPVTAPHPLAGRRLLCFAERGDLHVEVADVEASDAEAVCIALVALVVRVARTRPDALPAVESVPGGFPTDYADDLDYEDRRRGVGFTVPVRVRG